MKYPEGIKQRENIELKLGIKSSLPGIRVAVATLYVFFLVNGKKSSCLYSEEKGGKIVLSDEMKQKIKDVFGEEIIPKIETSPLFEKQFEPIYVFMALVYSLGIIEFDSRSSAASERKNGIRYDKKIIFSANMIILDAIVSSQGEKGIKDFVIKWLANEECEDKEIEKKILQVLQIFSEQAIYKLNIPETGDLVLQTEGIYNAINDQNDVVSVGSSEPVGPFRIIKSALTQNLNPYLQCKKNSVSIGQGKTYADLCSYREMVSTMLDICKREYKKEDRGAKTVYNKPVSGVIGDKYRPFVTAIKTKPFLLLAGISGTGKSRIVRELARACWDTDSPEYKSQKPRNFEMVQVKPNWHDSSELIGYVSRVSGKPEFVAGDFLRFVARAWAEPDIPYFLCLDEMNLAPVEQYFAEYLSVLESRKAEDGVITTDPIFKKVEKVEETDDSWYEELVKELTKGINTQIQVDGYDADKVDVKVRDQFMEEGIAIPQNLIVIGTVNMDETTYSFSRKVLDRAMTIEMNEVDFHGGLDSKYEEVGKLSGAELIGTDVEGVDVYEDNRDICDKVLDYLVSVNETLKDTPFAVGYRTRNEFLLYVLNNLPYNKDKDGNELPEGYVIARALDEITSMKILSRIEGDDTKVSDELLAGLQDEIRKGLDKISGVEESVESKSIAKLEEMKKRLEKSGYTSFWG